MLLGQHGVSSAEEAFYQRCRRFRDFAAWQPAEVELLDDLSDGQLDQSLLEAALIVGGHDLAQVAALETAFRKSCRRCRERFPRLQQQTLEQQCRILFDHLKSSFLDGEYVPDLCDVGATISSGKFNCLTATILYQTLGQEFGLSVQAAWEPAHVRCWVPSESGRAGYLVETTADRTTAAVSGLYPRQMLRERPLSKEQLLGKVFYNRGVRELERDDFRSAICSTWASCLLDPTDIPAKNNLRACLNNWALQASKRDQIGFAIRLLDAGLQLDPDYEPFSRNLELLRRH